MPTNEQKIRVLIVDDSFLMRRLLTDILNSDKEITVVGSAKNGEDAIKKIRLFKPNVVTMDYHLPDMSGADITRKILSKKSLLPVVIMVSAYTKKDAKETLESLDAGAVDYIEKPSGEVSLDLDSVKESIIKKVKELSKVGMNGPVRPTVQKKKKKKRPKTIYSIVIGASTGGPVMLEDTISHLSINIDLPIFIVQHMSKHFTAELAKRLNSKTDVPVLEISDGMHIQPGTVYVMPGGYHLLSFRNTRDGKKSELIARIEKRTSKNGNCPSIDEVMCAVAKQYGSRVLAVVLSGMGKDSVEGVTAIKKEGGYCITQDPSTALIASMPNAIIEKGLADEILSPKEITQAIKEIARK
ncbi:chemotaxis-specific protein-glutamate methyltransferase CheB [Patescibacteria group bacterium]|nr:chemotaxis-specific protein-glutamate methyltransferase CheB [Patescibacteria group bacterium]